MFDEDNVGKTSSVPLSLDSFSIEDLEERIVALRAEIERTQAAILHKKASLNAAEALFGKKGG